MHITCATTARIRLANEKRMLTRCGHWGSKGPHANFTAKFFKKKQFCHFILHAQTYLIHFNCVL